MADELNKLFDTSSKARAAGHTRFFNGKPCKRAGHIAERLALNGVCVECHRANGRVSSQKARYGDDRQAYLAKQKAWRKDWISRNPENLEKYRALARKGAAQYRKKNPLPGRVDYANLRAKRNGISGRITVPEIEAMIAAQCNKCATCKVELDSTFHIDHKQPMILRGTNSIENIQILCAPCNRRKGSMSFQDWLWLNGLAGAAE